MNGPTPKEIGLLQRKAGGLGWKGFCSPIDYLIANGYFTPSEKAVTKRQRMAEAVEWAINNPAPTPLFG